MFKLLLFMQKTKKPSTTQSLELENLSVLCRLGADKSSEDVVTTASDGIAPESSLPQVVEKSRSLE